MLLIHKVVPKPGTAIRNSAIREAYIECAQEIGYADNQKPMQEADGRISKRRVILETTKTFRGNSEYLKAGSLPKKATKVIREIVMVKIAMFRARPISILAQIAEAAWRGNETWPVVVESILECLCSRDRIRVFSAAIPLLLVRITCEG